MTLLLQTTPVGVPIQLNTIEDNNKKNGDTLPTCYMCEQTVLDQIAVNFNAFIANHFRLIQPHEWGFKYQNDKSRLEQDFACRRIRIHSIHSFQWQIWGGPQDSMEAPFAIKSQPSCQMSSLCLLHYYVIFSLFLDSKRRDTTFTNHILKIRQMSIDIIDIRSPSKEKSLAQQRKREDMKAT